MLVTVGTRSAEHFLRSQVGMGSESDCLLGQLNRILEILDSEPGCFLLISSGVSILWGVEICLFPWELKVADKTI